jgi:hypothetical protein
VPNFEVGFTGIAAGSAAAYATLNAAASRRVFLREQGWFTTSAVATQIGMNTPANTPTNQSSLTPLPLDTNDATGTSSLATAWSTVPTAPTNVYFRKVTLGAASGAGVIWKKALDEPWVLAKSAYWVWWNYGGSAGAAPDAYLEIVE